MRLRVVTLLGGLALLSSCGGRTSRDAPLDPVPQCTPGQQIACACIDGTEGAQRCRADGTFDACTCASDTSGTGGTSSSAAGGTRGMQGGTGGGATGLTGGTGAEPASGGSGAGAGKGGENPRGGSGGDAGSGPTQSNDGRRLPLPCTAPLPTGYCLVSDKGDYIGGGKSSEAGDPGSVTLGGFASTSLVELRLQNSSTSDDFTADFAPPEGELLAPGLYEGATRYPFQLDSVPGLSIYGDGRGCNELTGQFAVEELERDPTLGLVRFSATFEQHCEGGTPALHGVVNLAATGVPDSTPTPNRSITLAGKIFRVVYDPAANLAYGLDATNRRLAKIDLTSAEVTYADVVQVPNDGCLDPARGRLFVVNKGSSLITEYDTKDLSRVRDIDWAGTDWGPDETEFKIYCTPERVYVVDGAWAPGLFSIDGLDDSDPVVTDHSMDISGVGGLVVNQTATDLYYWYQYGWSAGLLNTAVHRVSTEDFGELDVTGDVSDYNRDPLDAPILLDESRSLVFSKNKIFDATNLGKVVYSLPSAFDTFDGAAENAYALDSERGRIATKNYVYELDRYDIVTPTLLTAADQLFFDASGALWFLSVSKGTLVQQLIEP